MRSRRRVTLQPTGQPSRILNAATDLRALVTMGCWPAIMRRSATALSMTFLSAMASPTPMFSVIFSIRGTCMTVL